MGFNSGFKGLNIPYINIHYDYANGMHILRTVCGKVRLLFTYTVYNVTVLSTLVSAISVCHEVK